MPICCQFALDAVPTPQTRALLSGRGQSDISETRRHAFLNTHVRKKLMLRESKAVGKRKEEKPWRLCVRKKFQRQGIQSAPPPHPHRRAAQRCTWRRARPVPNPLNTNQPSPLALPYPVLESLGPKRQDPGISLSEPAWVECLMGQGWKHWIPCNHRAMCEIQWSRLSSLQWGQIGNGSGNYKYTLLSSTATPLLDRRVCSPAIQNDPCTRLLTATLIRTKKWKQSKCPSVEGWHS